MYGYRFGFSLTHLFYIRNIAIIQKGFNNLRILIFTQPGFALSDMIKKHTKYFVSEISPMPACVCLV